MVCHTTISIQIFKISIIIKCIQYKGTIDSRQTLNNYK